jgi:HEAT repeat protein
MYSRNKHQDQKEEETENASAMLLPGQLECQLEQFPPSPFSSSSQPRVSSTRFFSSSCSSSSSAAAASSVNTVDASSVSSQDVNAEAVFRPLGSDLVSSEGVSEAMIDSLPSPDLQSVSRDMPHGADGTAFYPHRVFISHRGTRKHDIAFPMMAIFSYFCGQEFAVLDRVTFEPGEENRTVISEKLSQSLHCLIIISKDFFQSKWAVAEVDYFFKAIKKDPTNPKKRKIIPLFMGLTPADCRSLSRSLNKSDFETPGHSLSDEDFERCKRVAEQLSQFSGLPQHERSQVSEEEEKKLEKAFILNQMPDLLKKYLRDGGEPSLLPDFEDRVNRELLAYIYDEAVSYYQRVKGEVNLTNFLRLITKLRLQTSLRAQYAQYDQLERLFDGRKIPIADSFINLTLIRETEHTQKEKCLSLPVSQEEKSERPFVDERLASHEELYAAKEPLALNQLFEPKEDTETPDKILILGRAGIGKSVLCQYLAVQWASGSAECKDEEKKAGEMGGYLQKKFHAVFWVKLREIANFLNLTHVTAMNKIDHHSILGYVIYECSLKGLNKPLPIEIENYIKSHTDKVLFILDGYDEITDSVERPEFSLLNLFLARVLDHQHVLLTSRPLAIDSLGQSKVKFNRKLENIGFTNENIESYVHHFMRDAEKPKQAELLLKFLKTHPSIWGIAHIPINLELLSWLWSQGDLELEKGEIKTLSKLYQAIVDRVQDKYVKKSNPVYAGLLQNSFENKEEELSFSDLVNEFLECLAYEAMQQESLLIPKKQLKKALSDTLKKHRQPNSLRDQERLLKSATDKLGFLRSTGQGGRSQQDQVHYFIHLSFQEFYAARYITRILSEPVESQEKTAIIEQIRTEKYTPCYQLMLWITAGLCYQKEKEGDFPALEQFWQAILSEPRDLIGLHHLVLVMHCLEECEADDRLPLHKALIDQQLRWLNYIEYKSALFGRINNRYLNRLACCPLLLQSSLVMDFLLKNLKNKDKQIKRRTIEVLGLFPNFNETMMVALLNALKEDGWTIRRETSDILQQTENFTEAAVAMLVNALQDKDWGIVVKREEKFEVSPDSPGLESFRLHPGVNINDVKRTWLLLSYLQDKQDESIIRESAIGALGRLLPNPSEAVIATLVNALSDKCDGVRRNAVGVLGKLPNPSEAVTAMLVNALNDKCGNVRRKAVEALTQPNLSEAMIAAFLNVLKDEDCAVRCSAIQALSRLPNPSQPVILALEHALRDKDSCVRDSAIEVLSQFQNPSEPSEAMIAAFMNILEDKNWEAKYRTITALGQYQNPSEKVIALLEHALKYDLAYYAIEVLAQIQNPSEIVILSLVNALKHKSRCVRESAIEALSQFQNPSETVITAFMNVLENEDSDARWSTIRALGQFQNPSERIVDSLMHALKDESQDVRHSAIVALGKLPNRNEAFILALVYALTDKYEYVREVAIETLSQLPSPNEVVMLSLINALKDKHEEVRESVIEALKGLSISNETVIFALMNAIEQKDLEVKEGAIEVLCQLPNPNESVIRTLVNALKYEELSGKWEVVEALGRLTNPNAAVIAALIDASEDENWDVRENAIEALGQFQYSSEAVIARLASILKDKDLYLRYRASEALRGVPNPSKAVVALLMDALKDNDLYVQSNRSKILGHFQHPSEAVIALLVNALKDRDFLIRDHARETLGRIPNLNETVALALANFSRDEYEGVRKNAIKALCQLPNPSETVILVLINALKDKNKDIRENATDTLVRLANPSEAVISALLNVFNHRGIGCKEMIEVLGRIPNPSKTVIAFFENVLVGWGNFFVKEAAIQALGQLPNLREAVMDSLVNALHDKENEKWDISLYFEIPNTIKALFRNPSDAMVNGLLNILEKNNRVDNSLISVFSHLRTNHIAIVFERLMHSPLLSVYLSTYLKENHLFCIDHENQQIILSLYNKIHKIFFTKRILIHLEEQIGSVVKQKQYPLDNILLDEKRVHMLQEKMQEPHLHSQFIDSDTSKRQRMAESQIQHEEEKEFEIHQQTENEALFHEIQGASLDNFEVLGLDVSTLPAGIRLHNEKKQFVSDLEGTENYSVSELEKLQIELSELIEEREVIQSLRKGVRRQKWDDEHAELSDKIDTLEKQIAAFSRVSNNSHYSRPSLSSYANKGIFVLNSVPISSNICSYWNKYKKPISVAVSAAVVGIAAVYMTP